jgi:uncharacterized protein YjeT (DUF2065 family)
VKRRRRGIVTGLLILATLCGLVGIFALWVNRQMLNPKNGTEVSTNLLEDEEIQKQVAAFAVDQLFTNVDVQQQISAALPAQLKGLSGPATGALRQVAEREAPRVLASPHVQLLWRQANLSMRRQLLAAVNGGGDALSTTGGKVILDLQPIIEELAKRVGLASELETAQSKLSLPPDTGQITIMESSQLDAVQTGAKAIRHLAFWLSLLTFLLLIAAVALAEGWRRNALRASGWILIALGVLVLLLRRVAGNQIVDKLVPDTSARTAAHNAWDIVTEILRDIGIAVVGYGVAAVVAAWLAGPTRPATAIRRALAPTVVHNRPYVWAAGALLYLLLLLWGPTQALREPLGIIFFGAVFAAGVELWCRQIAAEFPDAQRGETTARMRDWATRTFRRRGAASS